MKLRRLLCLGVAPALAFAASVLAQPAPAAQPLKLLPPYGELPPTFWQQHGTSVVVVVFAIVVVMAVIAWRLLRGKPIAVVPIEVQARQELQEYLGRPETGAVLSAVSRILRRYFIAAFDLPRSEPTTTEFCRLVSASDSVGAELSRTVGDFLRRCDERKFSPRPPGEPLEAATRALQLVAAAEAHRDQLRPSATVQAQPPSPTTA